MDIWEMPKGSPTVNQALRVESRGLTLLTLYLGQEPEYQLADQGGLPGGGVPLCWKELWLGRHPLLPATLSTSL